MNGYMPQVPFNYWYIILFHERGIRIASDNRNPGKWSPSPNLFQISFYWLKDRFGLAVSSLAMGFEAVGLNQPFYIKANNMTA